ncbi:hypothetical protein B0H13DRAFT_2040943 [Mycena leptocephala]|nr:hypothetical protein B0H13DRAFT_2040943 [Mycena leptocephala]
MIVPKDSKQAAVTELPSYYSGSGSFDNKDSKLKAPYVPEQSQPVTSSGSSSQRLRCTECGCHKVTYDSAPIAPRNIHGRRFTYGRFYLGVFCSFLQMGTAAGAYLACVLQIIVALISAGTGAALVKLLRLGRRTQPTKTRFCVLCGLGSGWFCLTGGLIFMNLVFYIPEPFPAFLFFTVVSILSGGLCITLVGAACAEYRGFRRANKRKIASFPNNLSHATPTDQPYPMKGMSTNYSV